MPDVTRRDSIVAPVGALGVNPSPIEGSGGDRMWSDAAVLGVMQVMQVICFDHWIEEPLRLADFVA